MFYDPIWDKQHEECGVLGIYDKHLDIPRYVYWGLFALQHRGQESGGIALTDGQDIHTYRGMGLISTVFANGVPEEEGGPVGIGHVRYSTTGSNNPRNIQPLAVYTPMGQLALAHNGNLTNTRTLREELDRSGAAFQTTMDSEIIVNLISRSQKDTIEERIMESMNRIQGAYSLVLMTKDTLYGVRDPYGFRPLKKAAGSWLRKRVPSMPSERNSSATFIPAKWSRLTKTESNRRSSPRHRASRSVPSNTSTLLVPTVSSTARTSIRLA